MEEPYDVSFAEPAVEQLDAITTYLAEQWSQRVKTDFLAQLSDKLSLISRMPYMYRSSATKSEYRECVINKLTILFYQVNEAEKTVEIISIQSTRSGPAEP